MSKRAPHSHLPDNEQAEWPNGSHDSLWDLLGRAPSIQPSPFFTRNVLRAVRNQAPQADSLWSIFLRLRNLALGGAVAAIALLMGTTLTQETTPADLLLLTHSRDFEVIAHLHELLNSDENIVWPEQNIF